ncbi:phosphotransferase [Arthrobacter glacialis]|uniref:Aminoglycoside phosphotransferase n=1 Tax=Arthrobacter glacialis TaxID=1664 RepID=A0A2S3ZRE4_ARTGL|nr:phosphotransferase [Arthrobacter glacialis]POH71679.1 aminoglycoside phosphotransferase [Arthrobacter glacialis]
MEPEWSTRIRWTDLPEHVRVGIEQILGSPVVESMGQQGGFSPGTADRVRTAAGLRAFVKAVNPALNEASPAIHRKEAAITAALPCTLPAASLIGKFDDGDWIALVLSDVEGNHPHIPWRTNELTLVLDALLGLARMPIPQGLEHLPELSQELSDEFGGWARIRADLPESCDPWILGNLDCLELLAELGLSDLGGDSLVHTDVRADNVLITRDNGAILVDWPWACVGSGWFDALTVLVNVRVFDPIFDVESVLQSHPVFATADASSVDGLLSGLGAYFIDIARRPAPLGLPTVRVFQQQQGDAAMGWLRQRISAHSQTSSIDNPFNEDNEDNEGE